MRNKAMERREFFEISAKSIGGLLLYTLAKEPFILHAQDGKLRVPLRFFIAEEAAIVSAACERIFPADETGPGATQAGVVIYIDHQLAGPYGADKYRYTQPPFIESIPEHGYQGKANPRETYRDGIGKLGSDFAGLPPAEQDARLHAMEKTYFFQLLRTHTIEGMFCDPMHGGNRDLIGWQLIGFPGMLIDFRPEIDKHNGEAYRPKPQSLEQILHHPIKPWEDEDRG